MTILAIDATGLAASAALVTERKTIAEFTLNYEMTHSQTLMPLVEKMTAMLSFDLGTVDAIACASGPGSFTGLRIGAATAKGLAYALGKKIAAVPTLDAMAYNILDGSAVIAPIMDARRNQVYAALYQWDNGALVRLTAHMAEDISVVLDMARPYERVVFLGDGVPVHEQLIRAESGFSVVPPHLNAQRAAAVGAYALSMPPEARLTADEFELSYLRLSQAEREAKERGQNLAN